jgi:LPXTG-motif cell wall-anchored protein
MQAPFVRIRGGRAGRYTLRLGLVTLVIAGIVAVFGGAAFAHNITLTAETSCVDAQGVWTVTWHAHNDFNSPMTILNTHLETDDNYSGTPLNPGTTPTFSPNPVAYNSTGNALTTSPFGNAGTIARVRVRVEVKWNDGYTDSDSLIVNKPESCPAPTTTTTTWATTTTTEPTTTTTEPATTTTTTEPATTTTSTTIGTQATTTTTPKTTSTTVAANRASVTAAPTTVAAPPVTAAELPHTGSASAFLAVLGVALLAIGAFLSRMNRPAIEQ